MPKKKKRIGHYLLCLFIICLTIFFFWVGLQKILVTLEINHSIVENQEESKELTKELDELKQEKQNLTNPEYLEYLARSKYQLSKEGEQVFKFPNEE
ncbi:MAG: septum formation initiator family protein [Bacillota bacterium]|nr:septum formation initiator family protein [Bacillota bacterium]